MLTKSYELEGSWFVNIGKSIYFVHLLQDAVDGHFLGSLGLACLRLTTCRWLCGPNHLTRSCSVTKRYNSRTVLRNVCFRKCEDP